MRFYLFFLPTFYDIPRLRDDSDGLAVGRIDVVYVVFLFVVFNYIFRHMLDVII